MRQTEFSDTFSEVLRQYRTERGISRERLAQRAGLHQTYVGLLERNLRNPSLDTVHSLARALDVRLSRMIADAERIHKSGRHPRET
jgi:transcriptional regulator with XRE-family HTH domain